MEAFDSNMSREPSYSKNQSNNENIDQASVIDSKAAIKP